LANNRVGATECAGETLVDVLRANSLAACAHCATCIITLIISLPDTQTNLLDM